MGEKKRVLFLCNGNSARSQMAEAFLRHVGGQHFEVFSAGADPAIGVHPQALETLRRNRVPADGLATKHVSNFAGQAFDFVITLCDRERETASVLEGADVIYWTFPDPAENLDETERTRAFDDVFRGLERRIRLLIALNTKRSPVAYPAAIQAHSSP